MFSVVLEKEKEGEVEIEWSSQKLRRLRKGQENVASEQREVNESEIVIETEIVKGEIEEIENGKGGEADLRIEKERGIGGTETEEIGNIYILFFYLKL